MQYLTLAIISTLAFASQASAQMPDLPQCLQGCFNDASSVAGCSTGMDLKCICTSDKFTKPAMTCVLTKCSAEDQQTASTLYTQYCVAFTSNSTTTATGASGSTTGTSAPASSTSTSAGYSTAANLGLLVAGAGITLFTL
ncbi:hypothetical protein RSOLAG22IIIB_02980 [Rhizoctonia solani]|uniref:CFEM domain-containing protein n=1 Tax=Rhizoctonia solani TaxID=456999 RepID=A0A0K6FLQ6_9AGAM|nr:hypothetical protein RSOLAG22IIIB_02980 [Rhizoctonia solani]